MVGDGVMIRKVLITSAVLMLVLSATVGVAALNVNYIRNGYRRPYGRLTIEAPDEVFEGQEFRVRVVPMPIPILRAEKAGMRVLGEDKMEACDLDGEMLTKEVRLYGYRPIIDAKVGIYYRSGDYRYQYVVEPDRNGCAVLIAPRIVGNVYKAKLFVEAYVHDRSHYDGRSLRFYGSREIRILTNEPKPRFSIDSPSNGDVVKGTINVAGYTYYVDSLPNIQKIWVSIDRGPWHEADLHGLGVPNPSHQIGYWSYTWDTTEVQNGEHRLGVTAWDGENYMSDSIQVTVENLVHLDFDISIAESFLVGNPVPVTATITNEGDFPVDISEMGLEIVTLNFMIITPDGHTLCFNKNRYIKRLPDVVTIPSGESYSIKIGDITEPGLFVNEEADAYNFILGNYTIQGYYESGRRCYPGGPVWKGKLESSEHEFTIYKNSSEGYADLNRSVWFDLDISPPDENASYYIDTETEATASDYTNVTAVDDNYYFSQTLSGCIYQLYEFDVSNHFNCENVTLHWYGKGYCNTTTGYKSSPGIRFYAWNFSSNSWCRSSTYANTDYNDTWANITLDAGHFVENGIAYIGVATDEGALGGSEHLAQLYTNYIDLECTTSTSPPDHGTIYGQVTDVDTGDPIEQALVIIFPPHICACTDEDGYYDMGTIEPGNYIIIAFKSGYNPKVNLTTVESGENYEVNFELEEAS